MAASSLAPRLTDILDAIERIRAEMAGVTIDAFEADWRKRWLVERGVEIISEASRHLTGELIRRCNGLGRQSGQKTMVGGHFHEAASVG